MKSRKMVVMNQFDRQEYRGRHREWISRHSWRWSCCYSVTRSCLTFYKPVDCSIQGSPVLHRVCSGRRRGWDKLREYHCHIYTSVQFSCSVMSDSLQSHESQHARPLCPSPTPGVYPNSCPSSRWCHPAISSSVVPFSSCPQSLPASGSFPMSQLFMRWPKYWSFSLNISPSNEHPGLISFRMDWLDLLALLGTLKSLLQHHSSKASILWRSAFFTVQLSHPYMTTGKTIALTRRIFVGKVMSLLLNMLSRLVITFIPKSKHLLISWLQSPAAVILEPQKIKSNTVSPSISHIYTTMCKLDC